MGIRDSVLVKHKFDFADFDGCMYGLVARHGPQVGHPINKPWRIACLNSSLKNSLNLLCNRGHDLPHTRCGGQNTVETQCYNTPKIAQIIHKSINDDVRAILTSDEESNFAMCAPCFYDDSSSTCSSSGTESALEAPSVPSLPALRLLSLRLLAAKDAAAAGRFAVWGYVCRDSNYLLYAWSRGAMSAPSS